MTDNEKLDKLNDELKLALWSLGDSKTIDTDEKRAELHTRIEELGNEIVALSKKGDAPVYIINLTRKRWLIARSYSSFWIRGMVDGEEYSVTEIRGRKGVVDTGRGGDPTPDRGWRIKLDSLFWPAELIAKDICREINGDLPALEVANPSHLQKARNTKTMGVFVSPDRKPSPELLKEETRKLRIYYALLVSEGDMVWRKTHDYKRISDLNREAVDYLGLDREWHASIEALIGDDLEILPTKGRRKSA